MPESNAIKTLAALKEKQDRLKAELAELTRQQQEAGQARLKELAADAAGVCDKVFKSIFSGQVAKDMEQLKQLSEEIMALDGRAFQNLTGEAYGAKSPAAGFYGKFVFEPLCNGRTLGDILMKAWGHSENIYKA